MQSELRISQESEFHLYSTYGGSFKAFVRPCRPTDDIIILFYYDHLILHLHFQSELMLQGHDHLN